MIRFLKVRDTWEVMMFMVSCMIQKLLVGRSQNVEEIIIRRVRFRSQNKEGLIDEWVSVVLGSNEEKMSSIIQDLE